MDSHTAITLADSDVRNARDLRRELAKAEVNGAKLEARDLRARIVATEATIDGLLDATVTPAGLDAQA